MNNLGEVFDGFLSIVSKMINKTDEAVKKGSLNGVKLSQDEIEQMKKASDDAKAKREELFKTLNDANNNN